MKSQDLQVWQSLGAVLCCQKINRDGWIQCGRIGWRTKAGSCIIPVLTPRPPLAPTYSRSLRGVVSGNNVLLYSSLDTKEGEACQAFWKHPSGVQIIQCSTILGRVSLSMEPCFITNNQSLVLILALNEVIASTLFFSCNFTDGSGSPDIPQTPRFNE